MRVRVRVRVRARVRVRVRVRLRLRVRQVLASERREEASRCRLCFSTCRYRGDLGEM